MSANAKSYFGCAGIPSISNWWAMKLSAIMMDTTGRPAQKVRLHGPCGHPIVLHSRLFSRPTKKRIWFESWPESERS